MYSNLPTLLLAAAAAAVVTEAEGSLREFRTDRPDATESPFTVDPGHVQLEMDFANWGRDRTNGMTVTEWDAAPLNLRFGVSPHFEAGLFLVPYHAQKVRTSAGTETVTAGSGDPTVRGKWNFFGNDAGDVAFGVIVDLKLPAGARRIGNGAVEGTVLFPVNVELADGWELGAMTGADVRHRDAGGQQGVWINSATLGRNLTAIVGCYLELLSEAGEGGHVATCDAGLTFKVGENAQLDVGAQVGITRAAEDLVAFVGWSRRY